MNFVGGAHPNHYMGVSGLHKDELRARLESLVEDKDNIASPEIKKCGCIISAYTAGMCKCLILVGITQTINASND